MKNIISQHFNKILNDIDNDVLIDKLLDDFVNLFNTYNDYEQHQLVSCMLELLEDNYNYLLIKLKNKIPNLFPIISNLAEGELCYDNMDIGFYVKNKYDNRIFQVAKRVGSILLDSNDIECSEFCCIPLSKIEIEEYKKTL